MSREAINVTDAELSVLEILWQGPATIREITEAMYGQATTARYATVQKLLERLEGKRCVARDRREFAHRFSARIEREALIGQRLQEVAEKLCQGSLTPLLVHLVENTKISAEDRRRLRKLIEGVK